MRHRYGSWLVLGALGLLTASCGATTEERGGLMLMIAESGSLGLDRIDLRVTAGNHQVVLERSYALGDGLTLPTTLGVVSNGRPDATVRLSVSGWKDGAPIDLRELVVRDVPVDRVAGVAVVLSARCSHLVELNGEAAKGLCPDGRTCDPSVGGCVIGRLDGPVLDDYTPGAEETIGSALVCTPNESVCVGNAARTCNGEGSDFLPDVDCTGLVQTCVAGACQGECVADERRCEENAQPVQCSATGSWENLSPCTGSTPVCERGRCQEGQPAYCEDVVAWIARQSSNYPPGQLFTYEGKVYRYDGEVTMTYVHPDCPPDQSGESWCQPGSYPWSEVPECSAP